MTVEVSIVIPTYNRRAMVREAVESVLAQTGAAFELIIVDDGSTDCTFEDLSRISDERIRIVRRANGGPASARNQGVAIATAPMIAFLDSDDLWMPQKLERQIAFMRANPDCAISQTNEIWIRNQRRVNPGRRHQKRGDDIFVESLRTCLISPSAVIIRTELFRSLGGFDEMMIAGEDYDLWLRILLNHPVGLLDDALVTRRAGHPNQLSAMTPAIDRFRILALAKLLADTRLADEKRMATVEVLRKKCAIYASGLRRRGRIAHANFYEDIRERALAWSEHPDSELAHAIEMMRTIFKDTASAEPFGIPTGATNSGTEIDAQ
jgi:glycosyltransferase involved in cell wall biosynthesis